MVITTIAAGMGAVASSNPYGLGPALRSGGLISQTIFGILMLMSILSYYILFSRLFDQQSIINQARRVQRRGGASGMLRDGTAKPDRNAIYRRIVDDGLAARDRHARLTYPIEAHHWLRAALARSQATAAATLGDGLTVLATVGATAPFIGLLGTVIGIYRALIRIGAARHASIEAVAGPVGEALIMTAAGLVVAVPAVLAYNWLQRRNQAITLELSAFSHALLGDLMSGGRR